MATGVMRKLFALLKMKFYFKLPDDDRTEGPK